MYKRDLKPNAFVFFSSSLIRPLQFDSTINISESDILRLSLGMSPGCTQRCLLEIPTEIDVPETAPGLSWRDHLGDISGKSQTFWGAFRDQSESSGSGRSVRNSKMKF
ncbi:hypothetical protein CROQUDRAFT_87004 [Cronartium quercuum f. sp. fusiforme G11]|uniref:Uncharacterized protein n=1 Tax=Cronartium quercuum f. sp. fusiforme G11 TaxID=708437 RepID=A0A9P6TGP0_9BASI|nr:hypothetical protein CROQUDRAFT_87004 [Cronartium quercuum f. sp. fusiforme G11]